MSDKPKKKTDKLSKDKIKQYRHVKYLYAKKWWCEYLIDNSPSPRAGVEASVSRYCSDRERVIQKLVREHIELRQAETRAKIAGFEQSIAEYVEENSLPPLEEILAVQGI